MRPRQFMFPAEVKLAAGATRDAAKPRTQMLMQASCTDESGHICMIRVRNLSETGLGGKIASGIAPHLDDDVALVLRGNDRIFGRVVWIEGDLIGVSFDLPLSMASLAQSWAGPAFEVAPLHANIGQKSRRSGLNIA